MSKSWILAFRPKTLTAALVPVVAATALVAAEGYEVKLWISFVAVLSALFIQIGTNLINDALDFQKGADTAERIGPRRVTQSGLLSGNQVLAGGFICFFLAMALGVPLVVTGGWPIVTIGLVSLACGYAYTGGPFPLAYRGLGDIFVIVFFGFVAVAGTFFLHTRTFTVPALVAGLQIGLLATVLIAINNLRDREGDLKAGKRTLAVRLGVRFARLEIVLLTALPFAVGIFWWLRGQTWAALLPLLSLPIAWLILKGIMRHEPGPVYNSFLARAAALHLGFGLLLTMGFGIA